MIETILYRCPLCGTYDSLDRRGCRACGVHGRKAARRFRLGGQTAGVAQWYRRILTHSPPKTSIME